MRKADLLFFENLRKLIEEGHSSRDNSDMVRPILPSTGKSSHWKSIHFITESYNIDKGELPVIFARPIAVKAGISEIFWIWQDMSNDLYLLRNKYGVTWWDQWDIGDGTIGSRYGHVVKKYDMTNRIIHTLKHDRNNRNVVFSLNQETELDEAGKIASCAYEISFQVIGSKYLDMTLNIRSSDYIVAGHINRMQYVALQMMFAKAAGLIPRMFNVVTYNLHYYENHKQQLMELYSRKDAVENLDLKEFDFNLEFNPDSDDFFSFKPSDFSVVYGRGKSPLESIGELEISV